MPRTNMCKPKELVAIENDLRELYKGARWLSQAQIGRAYSIKKHSLINELMAPYPHVEMPSGRKRWKLEDVARMEWSRTVVS